ncbi:hypothetical protein ACJIZ3_011953 [Penstemon smallii]|uniref:Non-structural maintenance of chromosomes element 4 n=1 Tax=Penstemon smallii TaxID=265156 RepID=A0ABD3UKK7_9LAMI
MVVSEMAVEKEPVPMYPKVRTRYRQIENHINEYKDEIATEGSHKFTAIMNEVENLHKHVIKPRDQVADAEAFGCLISTLLTSVKTLAAGDVTPAEFLSSLTTQFGKQKSIMGLPDEQKISWQLIGSLVSPIFMNVSGCKTMQVTGPMEIALKPRKLVTRGKRLKPTPSTQPEELKKTRERVTDTDINIYAMFEILKKKKKDRVNVKLESLILNRYSFAQTVENLFALSFLVKDGRVAINVDENGSHIVEALRNGPSAKDFETGVAKNHHFIFRFDYGDWELMKNLVADGEELMPHRHVNHRLSCHTRLCSEQKQCTFEGMCMHEKIKKL